MSDWDRLLDLTGYQPGSAQDLFTDRVDEWAAFHRSVDSHRETVRRTYTLAAPAAPRRNVLAFYGKGGVGKTSLSRRLESWLCCLLGADCDWGPAPEVADLATIRLDLHNSLGYFDVDSFVVELREELGEVRDSWPAFDYAFAMYWALHHRNEPMPTGSRRHGRLRAATDVATSDLIDALGIPGASLGSKIVTRTLDKIRKGRLRRLAVSAAPQVADLVSTLARDDSAVLRSGFAGLLAAELDIMLPAHRPCLVVFVDAVEQLSESGLALLNSVVWQLPHVLWVLTGRNRIRWADEAHRDVPFYGATR